MRQLGGARPRVRLAIALLAVLLSGCAHVAPTAAKHEASSRRPENISATSPIDKVHRLSLTVRLFSDGQSVPGLTPLRIVVKDDRGALVRDAIVYVQTDSGVGTTPKMTLLPRNNEGVYRVDLPLVYGSHWTSMIKAFSGGRTGLLRVEEDLQ